MATPPRPASLGSGPARKYAAVTPSDTTVLNCRSLYIGGTGDVVLVPLDGGDPVTFKSHPAGQVLQVAAKHVMAATSATFIVALY